MIEILIAIGLTILIIGLFGLFTGAKGLAFFLFVAGIYISSCGIIMYQESCKPTAIDVYNGKTTLEITYRDNIPIDSVVVFKNKEK
jgi:fucose permease